MIIVCLQYIFGTITTLKMYDETFKWRSSISLKTKAGHVDSNTVEGLKKAIK